ncbi:probable nuclear protein SNF4 [Serendipita indica DSM 11827]|uniref:Probable nuclear protein SNF4 n=1 Tax=Serendipita indica (strain DSM 11827) TaxID=1109443 RepID=G4TU77_SERID|nr:probable nuclear protein SNF4 [Serendipita indica DSM 11827]
MATHETPTSPPQNLKKNRKISQRRARSGSVAAHFDGHQDALNKIRSFLKSRSTYDVFPLSYRLVVLDSKLPVKQALNIMHQAGVWYYLKAETFETASADVETFRIESIRDIEKELNVPPPPLNHIHPTRPLFDACKQLLQTHARRLPLIDHDSASGMELIVSVLTQYRVLKFIANNCKEIASLHMSLRALGIGTYIDPKPDDPYYPLATATMDTTVFHVVHMFSQRGISAVPILDENGVVINLYETVDVTTLVRSGTYTKLDLSIRSALAQRSAEFPGAVTCTSSDSLGKLLEFIKAQRCHRLVVVEGEGPNKGKLAGMITLSDVLRYIVGGGKEGSLAASMERMNITANTPIVSASSSTSMTPVPGTPASPPATDNIGPASP